MAAADMGRVRTPIQARMANRSAPADSIYSAEGTTRRTSAEAATLPRASALAAVTGQVALAATPAEAATLAEAAILAVAVIQAEDTLVVVIPGEAIPEVILEIMGTRESSEFNCCVAEQVQFAATRFPSGGCAIAPRLRALHPGSARMCSAV